MTKPRLVSCIGFGDRAKSDLLPVLLSIYGAKCIRVYSNSVRKENIQGVILKSKHISDFRCEFNPSVKNVIVISVTISALASVFNVLKDLDLTSADIFIDTPIIAAGVVPLLNAKTVRILEDFPPSPIGLFLKCLESKSVKVIFFYKSFYKYHGYSLLRYLSLASNGMKVKKIFYFSAFQLYKIGSIFAVVFGKRDYRKARIYGVGNKKVISDKTLEIVPFYDKIKVVFNGEVIDKYENFENINKSFCALDDVEFCKRLGLQKIFLAIDENPLELKCNTSINEALVDYRMAP
jgi:hypothetical protein